MKIFNIIYFIFALILLVIVIIQYGFMTFNTLILAAIFCLAAMQLNLFWLLTQIYKRLPPTQKEKKDE